MSSNYIGEKIPCDFNTWDPVTLEPASLSGGAAVVYREDSAVESSSGVTLTADYDGRTGLNALIIDTTVNPTFYAADHAFKCVLSAGTVVGLNQSGAVLKRFNLQAQPVVTLTQEQIDDIADAVISGAGASDINIEPVPTSRVFLLTPTDDGLVSENTKKIIAGTPGETYAVDFRRDSAANQKIFSVDAVTLIDGDVGGVTLAAEDNWGREGTQAKFAIAGVTAGDYEVLVEVTYGQFGGPPGRGVILFTVIA